MMHPKHPTTDAMRDLVKADDFVAVLRTKTDEELSELSVRQGYPRMEAAAYVTLSRRHCDVPRLLDGMNLWKSHAGATEILDAVRSMGNTGGLA